MPAYETTLSSTYSTTHESTVNPTKFATYENSFATAQRAAVKTAHLSPYQPADKSTSNAPLLTTKFAAFNATIRLVEITFISFEILLFNQPLSFLSTFRSSFLSLSLLYSLSYNYITMLSSTTFTAADQPADKSTSNAPLLATKFAAFNATIRLAEIAFIYFHILRF